MYRLYDAAVFSSPGASLDCRGGPVRTRGGGRETTPPRAAERGRGRGRACRSDPSLATFLVSEYAGRKFAPLA
jgi:hypothetical protein